MYGRETGSSETTPRPEVVSAEAEGGAEEEADDKDDEPEEEEENAPGKVDIR